MERVTVDIPDGLAIRAIEETETQDEAEKYVSDHIEEIHFTWPDFTDYSCSLGSTQPNDKYHREKRGSSN